MTSPTLKRLMTSRIKNRKLNKGFTLMELILVIIIIGIMAVGISGFITLSTQTYVNATNRDEVIGNARFVVERFSRELRNAVPNSIRLFDHGGTNNCLQFSPIVASTIYTDIPVMPEPATTVLSVIPFNNENGQTYQCNNATGCNHLVTVYPLDNGDIYATASGKTFPIANADIGAAPLVINLVNNITFTEDSPTQRLYIINEQVSYCVESGFIIRYSDDIAESPTISAAAQTARAYMAGDLAVISQPAFTYANATLQRNGIVQIHWDFTRADEHYVFDHEVQINNVP